MKVSFHGATREVTGSCYLVENEKTRILVDCGMFQGSSFADAKNFRDFGFDPKTIDAVVVTHAHLDHCGRLPKLVTEGFRGKIYATPPTAKLIKLVLEDALQVMKDDHRRLYRPMLYQTEDVENVVGSLTTAEYSKHVRLDGISFRFRDAGHILGSAFVEIEETGGARVAFSGDLGNVPDPILKPTAQLARQDALIMESTYGDRLHEQMDKRTEQLRQLLQQTLKENGVMVIPAFAIERTQELLFELDESVKRKIIPAVDMYLDSPLAIRASDVFEEFPDYYNREAMKRLSLGEDLFAFPGLHKTLSREESKTINDAPRPKVIIAGSGMMNGGRIQHHLVRYLSDPRTTVLIIGYQAYGTLGRQLYTGQRRVEVLGERVDVKARIASIGAYSAHADQRGLLNWVKAAEKPPSHVYCTHGEEAASAALASRIEEEMGIPADVPRMEQEIRL